MSERMTSVELPGAHRGFADYGRCDPAELIEALREQAKAGLVAAQAVLDAADEDFRVATFRGPICQRAREVLREGRLVGSKKPVASARQ